MSMANVLSSYSIKDFTNSRLLGLSIALLAIDGARAQSPSNLLRDPRAIASIEAAYPPDVLACPICRQRLGLPPLPASLTKNSVSLDALREQHGIVNPARSNGSVPSSRPVVPGPSNGPLTNGTSMNGSVVYGAGRMGVGQGVTPSSPKASQSTPAPSGPPKVLSATPPISQLQSLPLEARQQLLSEVELPPGASIISYQVLEPNATSSSSTADPQSQDAAK